MSVREAAEILGTGRASMYALVRSGEIDSITLGRRRLVPIHALRQLAGTPTEPEHTEAPSPIQAVAPVSTSVLSPEGTYVVTIRRTDSPAL